MFHFGWLSGRMPTVSATTEGQLTASVHLCISFGPSYPIIYHLYYVLPVSGKVQQVINSDYLPGAHRLIGRNPRQDRQSSVNM